MTQTCADCGEIKPFEQYHRNRARKCGYSNHCKPCAQVRRKGNYDRNGVRHRENRLAAWRDENPEKLQAAMRRHNARKHGLTPEAYETMLREQGNGCAVCGLSPEENGRSLAVDHDHACCPGTYSCGKCVRALLCMRCNSAIGLVGDDPERLIALSKYLRDFGFMS